MTFHNIRHALRSLRLRPALSFVVIAMLALGIGATTALFSLFHQILLQPLNVPEPQRLVNMTSTGPKFGSRSCDLAGGCKFSFSYRMFRDLEARQTAFTGIAAFRNFGGNLGYREQTQSGSGMLVSGRYFSVLGLQPALGRLIGPEDEPGLGESAVVVISHEYWQTRFGGDPDVINQTLRVNGQPLTIIGVAPAGFAGTTVGYRPQIFVPLTLAWHVRPTAARNQDDRRAYWLNLFARVNPGTSVEQAGTAITGLFRGILKDAEASLNTNMSAERMQEFLNQQMVLEPGARGQTTIPQDTAVALRLLLGVTFVVLLIVCINIANLLLARGAARGGEMAIRASIGGSRRQLLAQLMTESTVLALIGGIVSLPVAATTLGIISSILPNQFANQLGIQLSSPAMAFAAGASLLTVLLFGLFPAVQVTRTDLAVVIKEKASHSTSGRRMARFRRTLVTAQIAFSVVLLVLAGLFTQSLMNVGRVNLGMDLDSVVAFTVGPRGNGYSAERTVAVLDRIEQELATIPGATAVGSASIPLIANSSGGNDVSLEGVERAPGTDSLAFRNEVSPGFFQALSIPLLVGRNFTEADAQGAPKVAIVNESFVRKFNLGPDAIGKRFSGYPYDNVRQVKFEIVGVVADAAYNVVKGEVVPLYFWPRRQGLEPSTSTFYLRAGIEPDGLMRAIPGVVARVDSNLPLFGLKTMRRQIEENVYVDRLVMTLSAGFAVLATLLAAIGLYGVLAYGVAQRTSELGLRLALGARPSQLRAMILRQVGVMALIGGVIGLAAALAIGRMAESLLFGLSGRDPWVLATALLVLSAIMFLAGNLPARRASKVSPIQALRYE